MEPQAYKLNNAALLARIEEIKRNPPPEILEFKALHPEYKTVSTTLLAEYAGISESTLKNLKLGKIPDSNCSTIWLVCRAFGVDANQLLNLPSKKPCNPETCANNANARLDEKRQLIAELEATLRSQHAHTEAMRTQHNESTRELGIVQGKLQVMEQAIASKDAGLKMRNRVITALIAALVLTALIALIK